MKIYNKHIYLILGLIFIGHLSSAQNIIISDSNFKKCLVNDYKINTNKDSEIDSNEARLGRVVNCLGVGITNLTGIQEFQNLKELNVSVQNINFINLNFSDSLEVVFIEDFTSSSNTGLDSINLKSNTNLLFLGLSNSDISSIDLSANYKIEVLGIENSKLKGTLDLSNNRNLYYL